MEKIFHIPHSSIYIPKKYINEYLIPFDDVMIEAKLMCDEKTHEMIEGIIFPYSRIFCDIERFNSDDEIMNPIGMGILYTKTHDLKPLRQNPSKEIMNFYFEHHKKLNNSIKEKLEINKEILFIDLHSYSKEPLEYELYKNLKRPEICIGLNDSYNKKIVEKLIYTINKFKYSWAINQPFKGCLLPSEFINDKRVHGIMIEIRKDIYNTDEKFKKIKEFLKCVKEI